MKNWQKADFITTTVVGLGCLFYISPVLASVVAVFTLVMSIGGGS